MSTKPFNEFLDRAKPFLITRLHAGVITLDEFIEKYEKAIRVDERQGGADKRKSYQVLVFQPELTHSVWTDWGSDDPLSETDILDLLRAGVESGEYVGWRVTTVHREVMGRDSVALARYEAKLATTPSAPTAEKEDERYMDEGPDLQEEGDK